MKTHKSPLLMRSLITLAAGLLYTASFAAELSFPETVDDWLKLARPQAKGINPCQTKGICLEPDTGYKPRAGALVQFQVDSSEIDPRFNTPLNNLGKAMQGALSDAVIVIEGHADSTGSDNYNLALSHRRAAAVKRYLITRYAIEDERLIDKGLGESKPINGNDTAAGRARNRRVEFVNVGTYVR